MPFYTAQMELKMASNVTADSAVNTLHFAGSVPATDAPLIQTAMFSLYDDLRVIYGNSVAQNGHVLKVYDLDDPQPRVPILESVYNFTSAPAVATLPHQVAVCMSYQADRISGTPQARRRGRIYLGPLNTDNLTTAGRVLPARITVINNAAEDLLAFTSAQAIDWVAYSPTDGTGDLVTNGWCDDTFDIQRRRQRTPVTRNVWP